MKLTSVFVALALTALIQHSAPCADTPQLSARFFYREDVPTTSSQVQRLLDDVSAYYVADRDGAPGQDPGPQYPKTLTFRLLTKLPTQEVQWVSIPLSTMASVDFQWLPLPRSTIGFKSMRISTKDGGSHSVDMLVDGHEYRYVHSDKNGVVKQDLRGDLELRMNQTVSATDGGYRSEVSYVLFAFRGIGPDKQRPHSPDNDWIIGRELIDRIEFVENVDASRLPVD